MTALPTLRAGAEEDISLPAEQVWEVIGDFAHLRRWAPTILGERTETTNAGLVRVISMPPDGREVRELLEQQSPFSYTYRYLGETANARNYSGTVSVQPMGATRSRIVLISQFDAGAGLSDEEAIANMTRSARGNLKAMKRALGVG